MNPLFRVFRKGWDRASPLFLVFQKRNMECETYIDINVRVASLFQAPEAEQIRKLHFLSSSSFILAAHVLLLLFIF